ncbi:YlbF family regulator [Calorimonas adulescens]|jgi:Protein of unknown function (DUF964).|uniref:UPF0342 protein FWJ32_00920 n=1 Tax=Calorimonas adulescens TaxID=2606906 RepID=A0A5D8QGX6_9THEO|nr:YlbF family regulator [Calorimonas adulescens]TZE83479.1 YlbF family regulator [Calorimonas adulescens]
MNVYDLAHQLARAMAESDEYRSYVEAKKAVEADETNSNMVNDFHKMEMELSAKQAMGQQLSEDEMKKINDMYQLITLNPTVKEFLEKEMRFSTMVADVFKIINDEIGGV